MQKKGIIKDIMSAQAVGVRVRLCRVEEITGIVVGCARAASGHAAVLPTILMKSRLHLITS
jgi:hypothetical protein